MNNEELKVEWALRPKEIKDFIGQSQKIDNLSTYIQGALKRKESLDHILFYGPPGLGKTTLASITAKEMGVNFKQTSGPVLEKKGDLSAILTDLEQGDILFIDEIHRIKTSLEEILYKAMEDFKLDLIIGQGVGARNISIDINRFTLIGATTRTGLLSSPLRDRFGILFHMDFYEVKELIKILKRSARLLEVVLKDDAAEEIARRSRGTPRIANRILRRLRDFAQIKGSGIITIEIAKNAFEALNIDKIGFNEMDRRLLLTIRDKFRGGPVGLGTLATALYEEKDTVEDVYEPFLIQQGYLMVSSRGRQLTPKAYEHLAELD